MSLAQTVEALQKRPLTPEELTTLNEFQQFFSVSDDDPLLVALAMMARSQLILESAPALLQQKVEETIELHRMALREQAVLIAKELIGDLVTQIKAQEKRGAALWLRYGAYFVAGMGSMGILILVIRHFLR